MQGETTSDSVKTEIVPQQTQAHPHHHTSALFDHEHHPYQPRNVNLLHEAEQKAAGVNTRIAVALTKSVGTMWTAYTFSACCCWIDGHLGLLTPIVALLVVWISQTFLQLTLLPVIMVGQNVLGRKSELQADEQFNTTMNSYNDIEQVMQHLSAQDAELLRHTRMLIHLLEKNGISLQQLEAEVTSISHLGDGFAQSQSATDVPATSAPAESEK